MYDARKSYRENFEQGPLFSGPFPPRDPDFEPIDFLGFRLRSRLGVAAGPLLSSSWIKIAAKLGFDILTYKTIRSHPFEGHPVPNILFIEEEKGIAKKLESQIPHPPLSITNSFGMPSQRRDFLLEDIAKAKAALSPGQLLIVSVVGDPNQKGTFEEDFIAAARIAKEAGAECIEANFSCPNVQDTQKSLYLSPDNVFSMATQLKQAISPLPLLLKVGVFPDKTLLKNTLIAAAKAGVDGIAGINSVSMSVVDRLGNPALGNGRQTSGICGRIIQDQALRFIKDAARFIKEENLDLALLGCGGISKVEDIDRFLEAGADLALTATAMMWDPFLARRYHECSLKSSTI